MKALLAALFCLLSVSTGAALVFPEVVPPQPRSNLKFIGQDDQNGHYHFEGQVRLRGVLYAGWVEEQDSMTKDGIVSHYPELHFLPERSELDKLPQSTEDFLVHNDNWIIVIEGTPEENRARINKYMGAIPDSFFTYQDGVLKRPVQITLADYKTFGECDNRYHSAKLITLGEPDGKIGPLAPAGGVDQYATYTYITHSDDGYVNLRAKPNAKSDILKQLANDTQLKKISTSNNWLYVKLDSAPDIVGYVHKSQVNGPYSVFY